MYEGTSTECWACHQDDYDGTTDPEHAQAGFSQDCTACHTVNGWDGATFEHAFFPLIGGHAAPSCTQCHVNEVYQGTSTECWACHQDDYDGTTDPEHAQAGFSQDCTACHTVNGWDGATFEHAFFPLIGGHAAPSCTQCHVNEVYQGTSTECWACHQDDYDGTTDPDHAAAHFPIDCASCHPVTSWDDGEFDHDGSYFPIYTGSHREAWNDCSDCHTNSSDYGVFSCIDCHEHSDQAEVDNDHDEEPNYEYNSNACYSCHPDGDE